MPGRLLVVLFFCLVDVVEFEIFFFFRGNPIRQGCWLVALEIRERNKDFVLKISTSFKSRL